MLHKINIQNTYQCSFTLHPYYANSSSHLYGNAFLKHIDITLGGVRNYLFLILCISLKALFSCSHNNYNWISVPIHQNRYGKFFDVPERLCGISYEPEVLWQRNAVTRHHKRQPSDCSVCHGRQQHWCRLQWQLNAIM